MICMKKIFFKSSPLNVGRVFGACRCFHAETVRRERSGLPIVHHGGYVCDLPPGHRFPMGKFPRVLRCLINDQVITDKQVWVPEIASKDLLSCVHTDEYLTNFIHGRVNEQDQKRTGFSWSEGLVSRCRYETGGTVLAAQVALQRGLACSTAGGTHHAFPGYGSGFCLINDLAVAAKYLMGNSSPKRKVLIVDLDVHQGDGTAFIFKEEPSVFTFSVHCGKNFPLRKQQSDLDVSVEDGLEDEEYLSIVEAHLPWLLETFRPDLVLYDAGVDPHQEDELGRLRLTDRGLYKRDLYVMKTMVSRGVPVAAVIGGGYSRDIDKLALRHSIVHRAATQVWREFGM
ncbi:putative histone deacetylase 11-like isoform 2 [Scophthalmus maximus]|uniref:Putative histone deacetylase 11-like isoform 2 n=2 Tax=Scophthalmus maximus TaxID=52904 RepID=A0A2U9B4I5_SCOMX|nr:putative histone deacetylase 11-like isoform 2 [Scophthalmus maximus]